MLSRLEGYHLIKEITEQGTRLELNLPLVEQLQKQLNQKQLLTAIEWIFDQGQELFSRDFSAVERAAWYYVQFLGKFEIKSLVILEVVGWACLSLSADDAGIQIPIDQLIGSDYDESVIRVSKQYVAKQVGQSPCTVCGACSEVLKTLGQSEDLLRTLASFVRKRYLGLDPFSTDYATAAFAALLWTYDRLQLFEAKEAFLAKYSGIFSDTLDSASSLN